MKRLGLVFSRQHIVKSTGLGLISKLEWGTSSLCLPKGVPSPFATDINSMVNHTSSIHLMNVQREWPCSCTSLLLPYQGGLSIENLHLKDRPLLAKNVLCRLGLGLGLRSFSSWSVSMNQTSQILSRRYLHHATDGSLTRDWLVKLWLVEKKRKKKVPVRNARDSTGWSSYTSLPGESPPSPRPPPPLSQSATGSLKPTSPEEFRVAPLLARSNLLITRDIEWANLMLGFEQENKYAVVDAYYPGAPVGFISEQSNIIVRQILRSRRPFIAKITDSLGTELFSVRRPFWWINSTIFAEIDGKVIGAVHRRWHLWRRVYDLYLGNKQFAVVENPGFWNWTFTLKDIEGNVLAEIDRDWRGFGFELFTDAGQYVIRFGDVNPGSKTGPAKMIKDLEIGRPLTLSERAVTVALAVSLDNDYFSRHGGWGIPFFMVTE